MGYKIKNTLKKSKMLLVIILALWISLSIVLASSIAVSKVETTVGRSF